MPHKCPLELNPNRVYTKELRKEYNAGLRNTKWALRTLPFISVGGALLGHFGTIWIDPLWGAGLLLLSEFYISTRFSRLRYRVQDALSNRYRKDFTLSLFIGVSPEDDADFDGDPCCDVGFLEIQKGVLRFYGDESSFILLPQEMRVRRLDGRSNLIHVDWAPYGNVRNKLSINVRHSPKDRIGKARRDLQQALRSFSDQPPTMEFDYALSLPPQFIKERILNLLRDPNAIKKLEDAYEGRLTIRSRGQLAHLIWKCGCGEVNIRSHKLCKSCEAKQTPMPNGANPQFEIEMLPSTNMAGESIKS